ncbi:hypothetical protein EXU57_21235 [Segetibacter sp. 3557_3]|uniref:hypothetical protein n=1 Tax=Segetibacter sp. 3557_3 TaxID=2547429 RepID=UPI001058AC8D|nr:hypothetical protein [Segetibacter sp. 3557_3]TDH20643.1 hypothetical protein EXU57_21235 [Segetibacter sp. 3557_3]
MENNEDKYAHIKGWGIDADPENDPTYPMKDWNGADHERLNYEPPPQQPIDIEILQSIERPRPPAVFGTSTPPHSLSGMIRRWAFRYSESTYAHWVPLVLADRINVVEGYIEDFAKGILPNPFAERGWQAEWKYNRKDFVQKIAIGVVVTGALVAILSRKNRKNKKSKQSVYYSS